MGFLAGRPATTLAVAIYGAEDCLAEGSRDVVTSARTRTRSVHPGAKQRGPRAPPFVGVRILSSQAVPNRAEDSIVT